MENTIVIDNGSGAMKVGISGASHPITFQTIVGKPKFKGIMVGTNQQKSFVGD